MSVSRPVGVHVSEFRVFPVPSFTEQFPYLKLSPSEYLRASLQRFPPTTLSAVTPTTP